MVMTENQLKGNWAEQYISSRLAENGCLVRHVPQGHDRYSENDLILTKEGLLQLIVSKNSFT
jgi:hypothetical protein